VAGVTSRPLKYSFGGDALSWAPSLFTAHYRRANDFPVGGGKIGEKQSRQSNSKYNFMQYVFFEKKGTCGTMGSGAKPPKAEEFSRILCLK